jgi:gliding motility-associated-like protein
LTNVSPGTYTVTVTASNACTASGQVTIGSLNAFALDHVTIQHPTCHDAADGSVSLDFSGGAGAITIQWAPSGLPSASQLSNLASGTYAVTLTDEAGCTVASIVTLDAPSPLEVAIEQGHIRCYGESNGQLVAVGIGGTAPYMYQWSGASPSSSGILGQVAAGQYGLTLTDANQCALSTQVSLTQPEALMLYLLTDAPNCNEPRSGVIEVDVFGGVEPYSYVLNGGLMQSTGVFTLLESGNYSIQVMDANGCQISEMTTLEQDEAFELALPIDLSIDLGESVALTPQYADSLLLQFLWQAPYEGTLSCVSCEVPIASPLFTTTYTLHASDDMGCTVSRQITVYVRPNRVVLVPSAFTPNGDGRNDMLLVHGKEGTHIHRFQVFNRWGELIFESHDFGINNPTIGWDGSYRGEQMNAGVYIWSLEVEYADGFRDVLSGQTNLIR